jgi:hypothetical protein
MKDIFARCSKKMAIQVCTKLWLHNYALERNYHELFVACYLCLIMIIPCPQARLAILIDVYFCRLKINHDSHEFILEFGTIANNASVKGGTLKEAPGKPIASLFSILCTDLEN